MIADQFDDLQIGYDQSIDRYMNFSSMHGTEVKK